MRNDLRRIPLPRLPESRAFRSVTGCAGI